MPDDPTRSFPSAATGGATLAFDPALDAGLAVAFAADATPGGWSRPPLLRDDPSDSGPVVRPGSADIPKADPGRHQLLGEIARGGMGVILKGRDPDLGRDLAVKVLKREFAGRLTAEQRFVEEAQVGGQLQHPGIVPAYELGRFADGRPFFTMKLVKGRTLAALLAERPNPEHGRGLFLKHFERVCETVAFAHSRGVIHRDLKPANIMVGNFGEVQVMDWGLAKVLPQGGVADERLTSRGCKPPCSSLDEPTIIRTDRVGSVGSETQAGSVLGTPAFMPPEQAGGEIDKLDERADVFGLGAILCVILTGEPPYVGDDGEAVRLLAIRGKLDAAFARLDACGADAELAGLCKRCLAPERDNRQRNAGEVKEEIAKYLNSVEERARRAEVERAAAEVRSGEARKRHRVQLVLAATVLLAVMVGGGGWLWVKNDRDVRQAQVTRDVNEALNRASALREQAKFATVGGPALYAQAREQAQRALALVENGPTDDVLKSRVSQLQSELDAEEKDRKLITALHEAQLAQAETLSENRFAVERAVPLIRDAFRDYGLPSGEGEPGAVAERIRQRPAEVRDAVVDSLDQWDELAGRPNLGIEEPHREWVRAVLAAAEPEDSWIGQVRAARTEKDPVRRKAALEKLAESADVTKVPPATLRRLAARLDPAPGVALLRRARAQYPADFWINHNLGMTLSKLPSPDREEAVRYLTAAVALRPDSPGCLMNLGIVLFDVGQSDEAIACYRKAIELDPKYAMPHYNLGVALRTRKDVEGAEKEFREAIRLDPINAKFHFRLGGILRERNDIEGAEKEFREPIRLAPKNARHHHDLGDLYRERKDLDKAETCYREAIRLDPNYGWSHHNLADVLRDRKDPEGAEREYREAVRLEPKYARFHHDLGNFLRDVRKELDGAERCYREAIQLYPGSAWSHFELANVLRTQKNIDEAEKEFREAIMLDSKHARSHHALGNLLREERKDMVGAEKCYREALKHDPNSSWSHFELGELQIRARRPAEGAAELRNVLRLDPKEARLLHRVARIYAAGPDGVRDGKRAVELATRSCELDAWKTPLFIDTLAAAYAEVGDFEKAVEYEKKALATATALNLNRPPFRERLALYERKQPYRDPTLAPAELAPPPRAVTK